MSKHAGTWNLPFTAPSPGSPPQPYISSSLRADIGTTRLEEEEALEVEQSIKNVQEANENLNAVKRKLRRSEVIAKEKRYARL